MSLGVRQKILQRMDELGIQPKRSLGQNFLVSDTVVSRILAAAEVSQFSEVIEVGPGLGALTDALAAQAESFRLIEMDCTLAQYWRDQGLPVIESDALRVPWDSWPILDGGRLLVSNLPYQISSRLVVDLSLGAPVFQRMVLMFQKEVAQRIQATVGSADYGLLSVVAQSCWDISKVTEAGSIDFFPKPKVASRVLKFQNKQVGDNSLRSQDYLNFLKLSFANRRKVLLPKLTALTDKEPLLACFAQLGIDRQARAESLPVATFQSLYRALKTE
jgi:16S rRNA (adenine1518-N6/adenine1519-N6)-dimethyltransferase